MGKGKYGLKSFQFSLSDLVLWRRAHATHATSVPDVEEAVCATQVS